MYISPMARPHRLKIYDFRFGIEKILKARKEKGANLE